MITNIRLGRAWARYMNIQSSNPAAIFVPGNLQEIESLSYYIKCFSRYYDLYVLEPPGAGLTPPLAGSKTFGYLADCLNEFAQKIVGRPHHLLTCSYATPLALEYARDYGDQLLSLSLAGSMSEVTGNQRLGTMALMGDVIRDRGAFASNFIALLTAREKSIPRHGGICRAAKQRVAKYTDDQIRCFLENTVRILSYHFKPLPSIPAPIACFTGAYDPYVTPNQCRNLATRINAGFELIPDSDHLFHIENPQATAKAMLGVTVDERMVA